MKNFVSIFGLTILFVVTISIPITRAAAEMVPLGAYQWPPYEINKPKNELRGTDLEVIEEAFSRIGLSVTFKFLPWKRQMLMAKRGEIAGVTVCAWRKEREEFFLFSDVVSYATDGFFWRRGFNAPELKSLEDIRGRKVGGGLGYQSFKTLQEVVPNARSYRTEELALNHLMKERIDYLYLTKEVSEFIAKQLGISGKLNFSKITQKTLHICFSKKWSGVKGLMTKFNKSLAEIKADGTYKKIHDKYR